MTKSCYIIIGVTFYSHFIFCFDNWYHKIINTGMPQGFVRNHKLTTYIPVHIVRIKSLIYQQDLYSYDCVLVSTTVSFDNANNADNDDKTKDSIILVALLVPQSTTTLVAISVKCVKYIFGICFFHFTRKFVCYYLLLCACIPVS